MMPLRLKTLLRAAALAACLTGAAAADGLSGPGLAAASNFGQGFRQDVLEAAAAMRVRDLRDAVYWDRVEDAEGRFVFDQPTTTYPDRLPRMGAGMSLTVNNGHPAHDGGVTPHSAAAVRAFGRHAAETVRRFPAIHSVEVGNEINSENFVTGPVKDAPLARRAAYYAALLASVHDQVKAVDPTIRILGGGAHSIPTGYLEPLFALGAARYMDALAIHPYTTPPEQLARQIAVLRTLPGMEDMPIEVTEYGDPNPDTAPATLLKAYCQMALAGVTRLVWYPLHDRGDGLAPLVEPGVGSTAVGRTYALIAKHLEGRPVQDLSPDPFTYGCAFGDTAAVLWGAPRTVGLAPGVRAFSATGDAVDAPALSEEDPLLLLSDGTIPVGEALELGPQTRVADSFHQFALPGGGLQVFSRAGGQDIPMTPRPGQGRPGTWWTPHLGLARDPGVRMTADDLLPGGNATAPIEIVHRYVAPRAQRLRLQARFAPVPRSRDGIRLHIRQGSLILYDRILTETADLDMEINLLEGEPLDLAVGPNGTPQGDLTAYRIRLSEAPG